MPRKKKITVADPLAVRTEKLSPKPHGQEIIMPEIKEQSPHAKPRIFIIVNN